MLSSIAVARMPREAMTPRENRYERYGAQRRARRAQMQTNGREEYERRGEEGLGKGAQTEQEARVLSTDAH